MALSNTLSAITRNKFMKVLVDNIFDSNILCHKLLRNAEKLDGGVAIKIPVEYQQNHTTNSGWLAPGGGTAHGGDPAATGQKLADIAKAAVYPWATGYNSIIIASDEQYSNMGDNQVLSLLKSKLSNAEKTLKDTIGSALFAETVTGNAIYTLNGRGIYDGATNVAATFLEHDNGNGLIHDLDTLGADGASTLSGTVTFLPEGAVADSIIGYDRSLAGITSAAAGTDDFWNSNLGTFEYAIGSVSGDGSTAILANGTNDTGSVSFANFCTTSQGVARGVKAMTQMYSACTIDADAPDLIVCSQVLYDCYESALQANKRFESDTTMADAAFSSLKFKGASVVADSHVPDGQMYFLNTKYLDFKVHSKRNFAFEDFRPMEAADAIQARIFLMTQLTCSAPRTCGMLVGGPTGY